MDLPAANGLVASGSTARLVRSSSLRLSGALQCARRALQMPAVARQGTASPLADFAPSRRRGGLVPPS